MDRARLQDGAIVRRELYEMILDPRDRSLPHLI
jgi:hypothetical protein